MAKPEFEPWLRQRSPRRVASVRVALSPLDIRYAINRRGETIASLAVRFGCARKELSFCIHQSKWREYPVLRRKLAEFLGVQVKELFGEPESKSRAAA